MPLLVDRRKLRAAASSMGQFMPVIRAVYPESAADAAVEAATRFLYEGVARDVFGPRFASRLGSELQRRAGHAAPRELRARIKRIAAAQRDYEEAAGRNVRNRDDHMVYTHHVHAVISGILFDAGYGRGTADLMHEIFPKFEDAVRRIKRHLEGIRSQNHFMMS